MRPGALALLLLLPPSGCGPDDAATGPGASSRAAAGEESLLDRALAMPQPGDAALAKRRLDEALAALQRDDVVLARLRFEAAVAADPCCVAARIEFGFLLVEGHDRGSFGGALEQFRLALLVVPDDPMARCGEAIVRAEVGDAARAEPLLLAALRTPEVIAHDGRWAVASAALAHLEQGSGRIDAALQRYGEVIARSGLPTIAYANARVARAELLLRQGQLEAAAADLDEALRLAPEQVQGRYLKAQLLKRQGDAVGAAREARLHELLRELVDHESQRVRVDHERTLRLRRELADALPDDERPRRALIELLLHDGRYAEARDELAKWRGGESPARQATAARVHAGCGDLVAAKRALESLRYDDRGVQSAFARLVLDDWRRGQPHVTDEQAAAQARAWGEQ
jgi:tetratricopeptide (TPR) repeat protein